MVSHARKNSDRPANSVLRHSQAAPPDLERPRPIQTVEIIRPFYQDKARGDLDMAHEVTPESRVIWTSDNFVALTSPLHGGENHALVEGKVNLIWTRIQTYDH